MHKKNYLINFLLFSVWLCICRNVNGLKVTVYYEALCPDSIKFITRQLYPNWNKISDYIDVLELVPYGKAIHTLHPADYSTNTPEHYEFSCQHGPEECNGNKYQACALSQNKGKDVEVPLVYCIMKNRNIASLNNVEQCAKRFSLDVPKLHNCANSIEADKLLAQMGDKTWLLDPNISFVPTIIYDDTYNETSQNQSLKDFVAVVCSKIKGSTKPTICNGKQLPEEENNYFY